MNYVITENKKFFNKIGKYNFCSLSEMKLKTKIAVDTETTGLKCFHTNKGFKGAELFAIQIGTGDNNYLIDLQEGSGIFPNNIMPYLKNRELVFHNAIFDLRFLYKHGLFPKKIKDTFIASKFYYNGNRDGVFRHSFGHVMERELGISYDKSVQKNIAKVQLSNSQAIQYCFNDVDKLLELEQILAYKINEENGTRSYELQCQSTLPLAYMEMCGMPLSKERWINKINRDKKLLIATESDMLDYIHLNLPKYRDNQLSLFDVEKKVNLNFNSPKQMIEVFKDLELDIINDKGKESLNSKVVKKNKHDFVDIWLTRQKLQKAISTFGYNVLDHLVDGRIYTSFNPMVDTSRISCKSGGVNFLNFPRDPETRKSFLAKEGNIMVGADYSNQEVYCGCDLHHDTVTLQLIKEGICLHCAFAKVLYPELSELTDNEIKKKHEDKRQEAKSPRFNLKYLVF